MTLITREIGEGDGGQVSATYTFDDSTTPPLITAITTINNSPDNVPITAEVLSSTTHAILWSGTVTAGSGTTVHNLAPFNVHMASFTSRDGSTYWGLPVILGLSFG